MFLKWFICICQLNLKKKVSQQLDFKGCLLAKLFTGVGWGVLLFPPNFQKFDQEKLAMEIHSDISCIVAYQEYHPFGTVTQKNPDGLRISLYNLSATQEKAAQGLVAASWEGLICFFKERGILLDCLKLKLEYTAGVKPTAEVEKREEGEQM